MSTQGLIYLIGSAWAIFLVLRWAWREDKNRDITVSDLLVYLFMAFIAGLFSWALVCAWFFHRLSKYGDKVVIRRKKD